MTRRLAIIATIVVFIASTLLAVAPAAKDAKDKKDEKKPGDFVADSFSGLELRDIGPAITSGRVGDIAVDPTHPATIYVAVASGGVWKTTNARHHLDAGLRRARARTRSAASRSTRTTRSSSGSARARTTASAASATATASTSRSTAARPGRTSGSRRPSTSARSSIDPRDSNVVYVAAQGPLWAPGGDRGLYKTTDGGKTWKQVLDDQREHRRHRRRPRPAQPRRALRRRLPAPAPRLDADRRRPRVGDLQDPPTAARPGRRSTRGCPTATWGASASRSRPPKPGHRLRHRRGGRTARAASSARPTAARRGRSAATTSPASPQYYQELVADPKNADRVYSMDTFMQVTEDGGKTLQERWARRCKHVDNHALWIDPADTDHLLVGCDGGLYETLGPRRDLDASRRTCRSRSSTTSRVDDAEAVLQRLRRHAGQRHARRPVAHDQRPRHHQQRLVRHRRRRRLRAARRSRRTRTSSTPSRSTAAWCASTGKTGETVDIKPQAGKGEAPLRWNWDSPLIISPHSPHAALLRRATASSAATTAATAGRPISPDLTRQLDRNTLPGHGQGLGRRRGREERRRPRSTATSSRSPSRRSAEGLLYAGTDDGLIQVTEDGGDELAEGRDLPRRAGSTYVARPRRVEPRREHRLRRVRQPQDGRLQALRAPERRPRQDLDAVAGDLPARGSVYAIAEDHVSPEPALRRHRVRRLLHARRRGEVGPAEGRQYDERVRTEHNRWSN